MLFWEYLLLGILQGITEFLPISSSGHTALLSHFFGISPTLTLDIFLNTATLISVLIFFRKQILSLTRIDIQNIFLATIPAVIFTLLFKDKIESFYSSPIHLAPFFMLTGLLVLSTKFMPKGDKPINKTKSIIIGIFQALAILPSLSRSGSTIFAGLLLGLSPSTAFNFSFLMLIPASLGAILVGLSDVSTLPNNISNFQFLIIFLTTTLVGILSLYTLKKLVLSKYFWIFGIYCIFLSTITFLYFK